MNGRVEQGFPKEKMTITDLKVFILRKFAKHIVDSTSFTKTAVKLSIKILSKMISLGNYTCSRSILMKNLY